VLLLESVSLVAVTGAHSSPPEGCRAPTCSWPLGGCPALCLWLPRWLHMDMGGCLSHTRPVSQDGHDNPSADDCQGCCLVPNVLAHKLPTPKPPSLLLQAGTTTRILHNRCTYVVGVDNVPLAVEQAREKSPHVRQAWGVEWVLALRGMPLQLQLRWGGLAAVAVMDGGFAACSCDGGLQLSSLPSSHALVARSF
jgi:hypothetical protein